MAISQSDVPEPVCIIILYINNKQGQYINNDKKDCIQVILTATLLHITVYSHISFVFLFSKPT